MSAQLDSLLQQIGKSASLCYDLNSNGNLTTQEQTVFYQYAEQTIFQLNQMHTIYDKLASLFEGDQEKLSDLVKAWDAAIVALGALIKSVTSPKLRAAVSATASAIDISSSTLKKA